MTTHEKIKQLDWATLADSLNAKGFAAAKNILTDEDCARLINQYNDATLYRKAVVMERHNFGLGEYKYFNYPLPGLVQELRGNIYPNLAPVANNWMRALNIDQQYPADFEAM